MGLAIGQVFVPQTHTPARTAEVDWGQAEVQLAGSQVKVHVFVMRSCFSGAAFSMASPVETRQAFLEGHALAFDWFAGVFEEVRYDNLGSAVKKVLRGRRRVETDRFIAMRWHYLFESIFTTPGIEGAHENPDPGRARGYRHVARLRLAPRRQPRQPPNSTDQATSRTTSTSDTVVLNQDITLVPSEAITLSLRTSWEAPGTNTSSWSSIRVA